MTCSTLKPLYSSSGAIDRQEKSAEIADVSVIVDGRAAVIHAHEIVSFWMKLFLAMGESIKEP